MITPNVGTLTLALTRREIESRHKGAFGGLYWYAIQNIVLAAIYSTVFGSVFGTRWSEEGLGEADFTTALFIGLTIFNLVAETMNRAPASIVQNANLVKKVVFRLQVPPVVTVGASLFNFVIAVAIMLVAALLLSAPLSWKGLWLPVIALPVPLLLELRPGEVVGILGKNGSGKSTLLQIICGTLTPSSGSVVTHGRIAALLELGAGFNPEFTGRQNAVLNATILGLGGPEIEHRLPEIVAVEDKTQVEPVYYEHIEGILFLQTDFREKHFGIVAPPVYKAIELGH